MKQISLLLTLFLIGLSFTATAQHKTVVYGDLGVSSVNISIVDTQYGTSTDAEGHYELSLSDRSKTVNLYYSCIGYQDTIVSLSTKELQHDSINISFKMRKHNYNLQEVSVTAKQKLYGEGTFSWILMSSTVRFASWRPAQTKTCAVSSWQTKPFADMTPFLCQLTSSLNKCYATAWATANSSLPIVFTKSA